MADTLTPAQRSKCMAAIRCKDTKPEKLARSIVHGLGLRFRLHAPALPGKPDLVFHSRRAVVFVHGCYWHQHGCKRGRSTPVVNAAFWRKKRAANKARDAAQRRELRLLGWRVLVVWECQARDPVALRARLGNFLGAMNPQWARPARTRPRRTWKRRPLAQSPRRKRT